MAGGGRMSEPYLILPQIIGAVARRRDPEQGVHVARGLDEILDIVLASDGRFRPPRSIYFLSFSGRRPNSRTVTSPPVSIK